MSIRLPRPLAVWEPQLRIFPEEIALALGPLMQRVAAVVGSYHPSHAEGHVFPDGFAGLAKRGTYERLIASDWMLADEMPDEFMRRSVMGEHLFWKVAWREPAQTRSTTVLFDAGPEQLGAPRLLHLAALAVFEARARNARVNFQWGILQRAEDGPMPGMGPAEVETLLRARGCRSARAEDFEAWSQRLSRDERPAGEVWVVGGERLRRFLPDGVSSLLVNDLSTPGERKLRADCRPAGHHARTIELDLPPSGICVQLMRDPFYTAVASRRNVAIDSSLSAMMLNYSGNRLWVKTEKSDILAVAVPNSPRQPAGNPRRYETLSQFQQVAVGLNGRSTLLVSFDMESPGLRVRRIGRAPVHGISGGLYEFVDPEVRTLFRDDRLSLCVWHNVAHQKPGLYLADESGLLLRLLTDSANRQCCEVVHTHTLALTRCRMGMCYAVWERTEGGQVQVFVNGHLPAQFWPSPDPPRQIFFGYGPAVDSPVYGQLAFGYSKTRWEIHNLKGRTELNLPHDFTVYGVIEDHNYEPTLIVVEGDSRTLSLYGAHGTRKLLKADSPIVTASGCHDMPMIAYGTAAGEIAVYSLRYGAGVLSLMRSAK